MELLENNFLKRYIIFKEILDRYNRVDPSGVILEVGPDRVNNPAGFIRYYMSGLPIGTILLDGRVKHWSVIDGNKRLRTIIDFISGAFSLEDGQYFQDLPGWLKHKISVSLTVDCYYLTYGNDADEIINLIKSK